MTITCPLSVLYKSQKDRIKDSIIKRVKVKKCRRYGIKSILRQVRKSEKFNSIPVRVISLIALKQRKCVVLGFFFLPENRLWDLYGTYSDFTHHTLS